ncbi:signal peptide peptidase SppA [Methanolapillus millepedarum]|uniref:signal peptide peptidase SppA n=1 Tax=Methanolapillus millepedarum TaxID=3028296 RepID=UPI0030B8859C
MNQDTQKPKPYPSGSGYRPYYSYGSEIKNAEDSSSDLSRSHPPQTHVSTPVAVKKAAPVPPAPVPPAPVSKPPEKQSWWRKNPILIILVLVVVVGFLAVIYAGTASTAGFSGNKIAVINIHGTMATGELPYGSGYAGSDTVCGYIRQAANDKSVKAIVLRVNSPGGSPACAQEIVEEINRAQEMGKPVVVSMGDVAASAAYYVSAQADYIYADSGTTTGSIGVINTHVDYSEAYEKEGINVEVIKSGEMKDIGASWRPYTSQEKVYMQGIIDEQYEVFVNDIADGRNMSVSDVKNLSDGRPYTGQTAMELGLVDDLGNFYNAVDKAEELAGVSNASLYYMDSLSLSSILFSSEASGNTSNTENAAFIYDRLLSPQRENPYQLKASI